MKNEIELKFLVKKIHVQEIAMRSKSAMIIVQGYLFGSEHIRVRNVNFNGEMSSYLTIKGDLEGISRKEFEYEIPYSEGEELIQQFAGEDIIFKTRYIVEDKKETWEIDVFHGDNEGLVIAELEIPREDYDVMRPDWIDSWVEVHDNMAYYNYSLAKNPFNTWGE